MKTRKCVITRYFQQKYALSDAGVHDFIWSVAWSALLNVSLMFPAMLAFYFIQKAVLTLDTGSPLEHGAFFYVVLAVFLGGVMFFIAVKQYDNAYCKIYEESARMRISLAEKIRKLPLAFFGKRDVADLSATIMEDATEIEHMFSHAVPNIYASYMSIAFFTFALTLFHWQMALAMFWVVPVAFLVFYLSKGYQQRVMTELRNAKLEISDTLQEGLDCIGEIKAYTYEKKYSGKLAALLDGYEEKLIQMELIAGALINFSFALLKLGLVSVALVGAWLFVQGQVDLFTYIVFLIVSAGIYEPFNAVIANMASLSFLESRINRKKEMDAMPIQQGTTEYNPQHFDIVFDKVSFSYDGTAQTIDNISFTAKQGEVTALVGPSGGGKSTTAKLAARFWDVDSGNITLGGENIAQIDPETLLEHYAIVFQDVTLFNFTVMENIRVGRKDATDDEVLAAARLAQCDDFVQKLPEGYNTLVGENGERLSGGERQRISIARAILKNAPIILLDEATASLDAENETKIQKALSALVQNKNCRNWQS